MRSDERFVECEQVGEMRIHQADISRNLRGVRADFLARGGKKRFDSGCC